MPTATVFIVAQIYNIGSIRRANHERAVTVYREFLALSLDHPEVSAAWSRSEPKTRVTQRDLYLRDALFDYLTSVFEEVFFLYRSKWLSSRSRQWRGWLDYMRYYLSRPDYREWWLSVSLPDEPRENARSGPGNFESQYDTRFQAFMNGLLHELDVELKDT